MVEYCVGYLFSNDKSRVALIKKANCPPEQKWQEGCFNGIGGKVDSLERPEESMRREFREEAGVDIPEYNWDLFLTATKKSNGTGQPIILYMFRYFSTERLQQVRTSSPEGEIIIMRLKNLLGYDVIDPARIFLALERRKFRMEEI